jgi:glycolate oxidase iron-sulfur subunit
LERASRGGLRSVVPRPHAFGALPKTGRMMRPALPEKTADKIPHDIADAGARPAIRHARRVLMLESRAQRPL